MNYDLAVVGDGIAAKYFLLNLELRGFKGKIIQFNAKKRANPCSTRTTSIVSLFGTKKGLSSLGDLIVDSYEMFRSFVKNYSPEGVEEVTHFILAESEEEVIKVQSRYGHEAEIEEVDSIYDLSLKGKVSCLKIKSFIIYPEIFQNWIEHFYSDLNIDYRNEQVLSISKKNIKTYEDEYTANKVLLCTGAYKELLPVKTDSRLMDSKVVSGSYGLIKGVTLGSKSFIITKNSMNFIYRSKTKELLWGSSHEQGGFEACDYRELLETMDSFKDLLKPDLLEDIEKSPVSFYSGKRQKGKKREPFIEKVDEHLWCSLSHYKNGFTFSFYGAKKILDSMNIN